AGDKAPPIFGVVSGALEVVASTDAGEIVIAAYGAGQFSGEANMISGRGAIAPVRVTEAGEGVALERGHMLGAIHNDAELSEILMRAFIERRIGLVAAQQGDVVIIGSAHSPGTLRAKEFLTRSLHPFRYVDVDDDPGAGALLDRFHAGASDIPVVIC